MTHKDTQNIRGFFDVYHNEKLLFILLIHYLFLSLPPEYMFCEGTSFACVVHNN